MTLILFIIACALLAAAVVDRWRRRPVLIVSTADGTYRGRRALTAPFALVEVELLAGHNPGDQAAAGSVALPGLVQIPRRQLVLIQVMPVEARDPEPVA